MERTQKEAGFLDEIAMVSFGHCAVGFGNLDEDLRGTDHHGETRNFSGMRIRTSWAEEIEYDPETDTTMFVTRNSIYRTSGNVIKKCLGLDETIITGREVIRDALHAKEGLAPYVEDELEESEED